MMSRPFRSGERKGSPSLIIESVALPGQHGGEPLREVDLDALCAF